MRPNVRCDRLEDMEPVRLQKLGGSSTPSLFPALKLVPNRFFGIGQTRDSGLGWRTCTIRRRCVHSRPCSL